MPDRKLQNRAGTLVQTTLLAAVMAVAAATGQAAERVVLGEYFTNLY